MHGTSGGGRDFVLACLAIGGAGCVRAATDAAVKEFETPYPLIDTDPHFKRVVNNFRPSDYTVWAGTTAAFPGALFLMGRSTR